MFDGAELSQQQVTFIDEGSAQHKLVKMDATSD